jgi:hypothetical protein
MKQSEQQVFIEVEWKDLWTYYSAPHWIDFIQIVYWDHNNTLIGTIILN